ncbi:alpha/beta hydrolase [Kaarinaea lacus]
MKRYFNIYLWAGILVIATGYGLGPTVELDDTIKPVSLPADLDAYIRNSESRIADLRPNTEKTITWANPDRPGSTPYSIIYLHGFSATRQEISPVCDNVANALGANLFYTRFTGHGRESEAMAEISVNRLLNDAVQALEIGKRLGNKVIIIGTSTGATLATWLADYDRSGRIGALVLLSPNYGPKRKESELLLLPWGRSILQLVEGPVYHFEPFNTLQQKYWTTEYPSKALLPMMGIVKLTRDKNLRSIQVPVLVMYSPNDQIVDTSAIQIAFLQFTSKQNRIFTITNSSDPQQHILAGDIMSPQTTGEVSNAIIEFLQQQS